MNRRRAPERIGAADPPPAAPAGVLPSTSAIGYGPAGVTESRVDAARALMMSGVGAALGAVAGHTSMIVFDLASGRQDWLVVASAAGALGTVFGCLLADAGRRRPVAGFGALAGLVSGASWIAPINTGDTDVVRALLFVARGVGAGAVHGRRRPSTDPRRRVTGRGDDTGGRLRHDRCDLRRGLSPSPTRPSRGPPSPASVGRSCSPDPARRWRFPRRCTGPRTRSPRGRCTPPPRRRRWARRCGAWVPAWRWPRPSDSSRSSAPVGRSACATSCSRSPSGVRSVRGSASPWAGGTMTVSRARRPSRSMRPGSPPSPAPRCCSSPRRRRSREPWRVLRSRWLLRPPRSDRASQHPGGAGRSTRGWGDHRRLGTTRRCRELEPHGSASRALPALVVGLATSFGASTRPAPLPQPDDRPAAGPVGATPAPGTALVPFPRCRPRPRSRTGWRTRPSVRWVADARCWPRREWSYVRLGAGALRRRPRGARR